MISVIELYCCIKGAIVFIHSLFGIEYKLEKESREYWVADNKISEHAYVVLKLISNLFNLICIFVLLKVICRLIG